MAATSGPSAAVTCPTATGAATSSFPLCCWGCSSLDRSRNLAVRVYTAYCAKPPPVSRPDERRVDCPALGGCSASLGYCRGHSATPWHAAPPAHRHGAASQLATARRRAGSAEAGLDGAGAGGRQVSVMGGATTPPRPRRAWEDAPRGAHAGAARRRRRVRAGHKPALAPVAADAGRSSSTASFDDERARRRGHAELAESETFRGGELAGREPAAPATTAVAAYTGTRGVRPSRAARHSARPPRPVDWCPCAAWARGPAAHVNTGAAAGPRMVHVKTTTQNHAAPVVRLTIRAGRHQEQHPRS